MPTQCIQVTFDPTLWAAGFGSQWGSNGNDCGTVIPDKDGTTLWCFEYFGAGFARVNATTGAIIVQDALFGTPGGTCLNTRENGSVALWVQDSHGFYYAMQGTTIYKFHIPSPAGPYTPDATLFNGYAVIDATCSFSPPDGAVEDWAIAEIGSTVYLAASSTDFSSGSWARCFIFNGTTMTAAGTYMGEGDNLSQGNTVMTDADGIFWFCCNLTPTHGNPDDAPPNSIDAQLVKIDMTTGSLVHSLQVVTAAVHGLSYTPYFIGYVPSVNGVFMACFSNHATDGVAVISMDTWTRLALHPDDLKFCMTLEGDSIENSLDVGVQNGQLIIEGNAALPGQSGGLLQILDPATLAVATIIDCVALMTAAGVPSQAESTTFSNVQNAFITSLSSDGTTGTAVCSLSYITVPPAVDVTISATVSTTWLESRFLVPLTASPTGFTFTDNTGHGAFGPNAQNPPYTLAGSRAHVIPPLSTFGWQQPSHTVGVCFLFSGSPVYIFPTPSPQGSFAKISRIVLDGNSDLHAPMPSTPGR